MSAPLVSVIVPAFNGARHLGAAIESVLGQTHAHLELIVADDASTDDTAAVVGRYRDGRVRYLVHERNRGPDAARVTALQASRGDVVAFLDQDDLYHPDKLEAHVSFMRTHPEVGVTYNPHFTLSDPSGNIIGILRPPDPVSLADLVLGFPIPPSACVMRREWATREELWDEATFFRGREIVFFGRLFVEGCRFALVDRTLNYRRIEAGRTFSDPISKCRDECRCQAMMLDDPRCPPEVASLRTAAFANSHMVWANVALAQRDTPGGHALLREAIRLDPELHRGNPGRLVELFLAHAVVDADDPEAQLRVVFGQLPPELSALTAHVEWAVQQALFLKGGQHVIWGRRADATPYLLRASRLGGAVDEFLLQTLAYELISHEQEFGVDAAREVAGHLREALAGTGELETARRLGSSFELGRAFHLFERGQRRGVPQRVFRAFLEDPRGLTNRGAWSILVRAMSERLSAS